MGFSTQEYGSGLPCPPPEELPDPGIKATTLMSPTLAGGFFTTSATWEAQLYNGKDDLHSVIPIRAFRLALVLKNPPDNARDLRDKGLIPGLGRVPGGEHGNPFQYSCVENPMDRGAWWAAVHGVTKSQTQLSD